MERNGTPRCMAGHIDLTTMTRERFIGAGIALGIATGALVSIFAGSFAFWIGMGICLGVAIGAALSRRSGHEGGESQ